MGLFKRSKQKSGSPEHEPRTFTMPCTPQEALGMIVRWPDHEGNVPFQILESEPLDTPPLEEDIYLESSDGFCFVIAAGNRVNSYWKMELNLDGESAVEGTFRALEVQDQYKWWGNVFSMCMALRADVEGVGGTRPTWPSTGGFL